MAGIGDIGGMVSSLQQSIDAAMKRVQEQAKAGTDTAAAGDVKEYEKTVRKSAATQAYAATDIGMVVKNRTRLNAFSIMGKDDPVDFYKFKVTNQGELALGRVGDPDVRVQLMDKTGKIMADSNKDAGAAFDAYKKLSAGELTVDRGDYTIRVTRDKGVAAGTDKQYALQLRMGTYSEDYDTYAKQPAAGDGTTQIPSYARSLQALMNGGSVNSSSLTSLLLGGSSRGRGSMFNGLF
ncbi:MAG TPA: hypothetical protein VGE72_25380 [Azospirillum sp.]